MSKVYDLVTRLIMERMEQGILPWKQPWSGTGMPRNLVTKRYYRGANTILLSLPGYSSQWWATRKQIQKLGGEIQANEKYSPCVFWKFFDKDTEENKGDSSADQTGSRRPPILRFYQVYNVEQCRSIKVPALQPVQKLDFKPIEECERIVNEYPDPPKIQFEGSRAYYSPSLDKISMPSKERFHSIPELYSTLFHEMAHSTGHMSRLHRRTLMDLCAFGSTNYSKEELVAELACAFLCGHAGIENVTLNNSAAYLHGWLQRLQGDRRLFVEAAGAAQKAVDHILGNTNHNGGHDHAGATQSVGSQAVGETTSARHEMP